MSLPKMRTAAGALAEIKKNDPDTDITLHYIRQLIHTNKIPVVSAGRKKLVDVDAVLEYLAHPIHDIQPVTVGQIRRVSI